jgi:hypothetical protein
LGWQSSPITDPCQASLNANSPEPIEEEAPVERLGVTEHIILAAEAAVDLEPSVLRMINSVQLQSNEFEQTTAETQNARRAAEGFLQSCRVLLSEFTSASALGQIGGHSAADSTE